MNCFTSCTLLPTTLHPNPAYSSIAFRVSQTIFFTFLRNKKKCFILSHPCKRTPAHIQYMSMHIVQKLSFFLMNRIKTQNTINFMTQWILMSSLKFKHQHPKSWHTCCDEMKDFCCSSLVVSSLQGLTGSTPKKLLSQLTRVNYKATGKERY